MKRFNPFIVVAVASGALLVSAFAAERTGGGAASGGAADGAAADEQPRDGVFVHLTKNDQDPHAVLMALKMANLMAADKDVLVYCDLKAVEVLTRNAKDLTMPPFDSSHTQIRQLLDKSVPIYACPGCLKALGISSEDLMDGIQVADKDAFFSFTKGRILTLDY